MMEMHLKKCRRRWWSVCAEKSSGVREMYYAGFFFAGVLSGVENATDRKDGNLWHGY